MKGNITEQYGLIKNGKGHKDVFLKEAKNYFLILLDKELHLMKHQPF